MKSQPKKNSIKKPVGAPDSKVTILLDTETTGLLSPLTAPLSQQPYITEIFLLKVEGFRIVDKFHSLIRPPIQIPPECVKITGITDDMVKTAPTFPALYQQLAEFCLGGYRWVAHNLPFDKGMLHCELGRMSKRPNFPWPIEDYCTVEQSLKYSTQTRRDGSPKFLKLTELHELATGKPHDAGAHRAEADVWAMFECYKWLEGQK